MEFVDTHCHIQSSDKRFGSAGEAVTRSLWKKAHFPSGDELVGRAAESGVTKLICVGCDLADSQLVVDFVKNRENCWASIGIHPHESRKYMLDGSLDFDKLIEFASLAATERAYKLVAIGECGLDFHYEYSNPADQTRVLRFQIELALQHNLPIIFHVREAFDDFWPVFDSYRGVRGVLHSFTDNQANLDQAVARGLYVGVNGIATFADSPEQRQVYKNVPLSRLLLETDAPFLTPLPWRDKICEPYHTRVTAEFLAKLRNESLEQLAATTTVNAQKLFNI